MTGNNWFIRRAKKRCLIPIFKWSFFVIGFSLLSLMSNAQAPIDKTQVSTSLISWSLFILTIVLIGWVIYALSKAFAALNEEGRTVNYSFPIFKDFAKNSKAVTVIIACLVLLGLIIAINY